MGKVNILTPPGDMGKTGRIPPPAADKIPSSVLPGKTRGLFNSITVPFRIGTITFAGHIRQ